MSILGFLGMGRAADASPPTPEEENLASSSVPVIPEPAVSNDVPVRGGEFTPAPGVTSGLRRAASAPPFHPSVVPGNGAADGARVRYEGVDARQSTVGYAASQEPVRAGRGTLQYSESITSPIAAETRLGGLGVESGKFDAGQLPIMGGADPAMTPTVDPSAAAIAAAYAARYSTLSYLQGA